MLRACTQHKHTSFRPCIACTLSLQRIVHHMLSTSMCLNAACLQAVDLLKLPGETKKMLLTPQREVAVELVISRDSGEPASFMGYRVQHDNSRGPFKVSHSARLTVCRYDVLCNAVLRVFAAWFRIKSSIGPAGRIAIPPTSGYR